MNEWYVGFKNVNMSIDNKPRSRSPSTARIDENVEKNRELVLTNLSTSRPIQWILTETLWLKGLFFCGLTIKRTSSWNVLCLRLIHTFCQWFTNNDESWCYGYYQFVKKNVAKSNQSSKECWFPFLYEEHSWFRVCFTWSERQLNFLFDSFRKTAQ